MLILGASAVDHPGVLELKILHRDIMRATAAFLLVLAHLALSHAWTCKTITLRNVHQIDAGAGQVVATDKSRNAYFLIGTAWPKLPSANLKHITVGLAGIWAVNNGGSTFKYGFGRWIKDIGVLKQMDAGRIFIAGANRHDDPYCLRYPFDVTSKGGVGSPWRKLPGRKVKYVSCGLYGCWAVSAANNVYRTKSVKPTTCESSGWQHIAGVKLTMVEASTDGKVFGVTPIGQVYTRNGITAGRPQGSSWAVVNIPMNVCTPLTHVSYDLGRLWVVSQSGRGQVCTH